MRMQIIRNVKEPKIASIGSAGIDFFVPNDFDETKIESHKSLLIPSGIKAEIPENHVLIAFNKSGVSTKTGLIVGACIVDSDYQGEIHLHVINTSHIDVIVKPGQKLVQFVLLPYVNPHVTFVYDASLFQFKSHRGENGFGSSGS